MSTRNKFVCIHGHFYQPPRENAWLEVIEIQDSAAPFHDWNERINFECYARNAAARILDDNNFIRNILNNYQLMSFNFGPTLLSWMENADPETYQAILDADKRSMEVFNGHGSAIAQVHSHLILPLCNRRDKETQVYWGIHDFEYRFGRKPEGIWLSETAVDTETLEVLAEQGIKFTILAPRQAKSVRPIGSSNWQSINESTLDTRRPYRCKLPSGKEIALFFYNGDVSQAVAFEGLLMDGRYFADRLTEGFSDNDTPELLHIATDGESYGHHHRYGEMALASALSHIKDAPDVELINYGAYLDRFPVTHEAEIHDNSSWSCVHGVERWKSNCGCNSGGNPGWNQEWRAPLRETLDWLRDHLVELYDEVGGEFLKDHWQARNEYISVMLTRKAEDLEAFFKKHVKRNLEEEEKIKLLRALEMQRHSLLMYTSCGWFFDEVSGIETMQILQYANRAIHYANQVNGVDLHPEFKERMAKIPSNIYENGLAPYEEHVAPAQVDLERVGMHYAVSSLFEEYPQNLEFFNYIANAEIFERLIAGNQRLVVGRTTVQSIITLSKKHFSFAALYLGQQTIIGHISIDMDRAQFDEMHADLFDLFNKGNLGELIGKLQDYFGSKKYTIWHLFRDEKRKVLKQITDQTLNHAENSYRDIYNDNYQLMSGMLQSDLPIPSAYRSAVQFIINKDMHKFFGNGALKNVEELKRMSNELRKWNVQINDATSLKLSLSERLFKELQKLEKGDLTLSDLNRLIEILEIINDMGLAPDIWQVQNHYYSAIQGYKANSWVFASKKWEKAFYRLGELLHVRTD